MSAYYVTEKRNIRETERETEFLGSSPSVFQFNNVDYHTVHSQHPLTSYCKFLTNSFL